MRILFIHDPPDLYGASRSLLRLASRLVLDGHEVLVVVPYDGPLRPPLEVAGVGVKTYPRLAIVTRWGHATLRGFFSLFFSFLLSIPALWRITSDFRPDIVHSNTSLILTPGVVARLRGIPHIWHIREVFAGFPQLWSCYQRYMAAFSDRIVCVSNAVAAQFSSRISREKICVLHNGFPVGEFPEVPPARVMEFRQRYNLDGNLLVGLVGRIKIGRKGQDVLLEAAATLKPRFPNVRFLFIGSPFPGNEAHLDKLRTLINELALSDEVVCTGDIGDIKAAYAALDISVQPSVMPEAFSGVVLESMVMGKPVVASRCGGTMEQIKDGVTGILVEPGNSQQLASALERLLSDSDLRLRLGSQGREEFLERFEFESFYRKLRALQSSLVVRS